MEKWQGVQVIDVPKEADKHVWLADVMKENGGTPVLAGVDGVIGCITAKGSDVHEARRRVYRTIRSICITDDVQYRTDIGDGVEDAKRKLTEWGWLG